MSFRIAFKVELPRRLSKLSEQRFGRDVDAAIASVGKKVRADYNKTMGSWKTKDRFNVRSVRSVIGEGVIVGTKSMRYLYLDGGTRDHYVRPRRAKMLRFQTRYFTKTMYRNIGSRRGGPYGSTAFSRGHRVSGILGREFTDTIADKQWPGYKAAVRKVMWKHFHI